MRLGDRSHPVISLGIGLDPVHFAFKSGETLAKFLRDPKNSLPGNRMSFPGIKDDAVLQDLLAQLKQATQ